MAGSAVFWDHGIAGLIPSPAQWVKDLALLQLQLRWQLWLRSGPWPGKSICFRETKKKKAKKKKKERKKEKEKEEK